MPRASTSDKAEIIYICHSDGKTRRAQSLRRKGEKILVKYLDDERGDEWVDVRFLDNPPSTSQEVPAKAKSKKRKRTPPPTTRNLAGGPVAIAAALNEAAGETSSSSSRRRGGRKGKQADSGPGSAALTDEEPEAQNSRTAKGNRNFQDVYFGDWKIKTWYFSPYPLTDADIDDIPPTSALARSLDLGRPNQRWHGRASDLLRGTAGKTLWPDPGPLYVCDRCFKYFSESVVWEVHQRGCDKEVPPGRKVYNRDPVKIWEIDGEKDKLYCQNLSLFGKLFIDAKTLFFDLDNFMFYVVTKYQGGRENVIGYFSKEKVSFDDYNLATIVTFPQDQKQGYGSLMIEFSYELSRLAGKVGTPERPLSDLGLRGYLAYWVSTLVRFFRRVLTAIPSDQFGNAVIVKRGNFPDTTRDSAFKKGKKSMNCSDLMANLPGSVIPLDKLNEPMFTSDREFVTRLRSDGSAETHVHVYCTLADIARATNLRPDDVAFALNECGLLMKRMSKRDRDENRSPSVNKESSNLNGRTESIAVRLGDEDDDSDDEEEGGTIVITREMVEKVAKERNVKRMVLDLNCVCVDSD
ncbi:hypothetical protein D9611_014543 [Ephemerocybe angulata]|uniref:histone acetyltransferase n=1 Tax=Ephemerocybe angulata TaxID=980116 RepID=A0A8H5BRX6_9AGAR|nr:hypothetical protein D9611_014543 [Tulosesus angulatus]